MKNSCLGFNFYILIVSLSFYLTSCINLFNYNKTNFFEPEIVKQFHREPEIIPGSVFWLEVTADGSPVVPGGELMFLCKILYLFFIWKIGIAQV